MTFAAALLRKFFNEKADIKATSTSNLDKDIAALKGKNDPESKAYLAKLQAERVTRKEETTMSPVNYYSLLKGGRGSGRKPGHAAPKSNFHHQSRTNSTTYNEAAHIKSKTNAQLDKDIASLSDAYPQHSAITDYVAKLRAERASRVGVTKGSEDNMIVTKSDIIIDEILDNFALVLKGALGKHWHWHDHAGSSAAVSHLTMRFPNKRTTHSEEASRFGKRPNTWKDVDTSVQDLHNHLTANGFKTTANNVEDGGNRSSQHIEYAHPDGTTVHSISNQPKDKMTELAHDVAVFHAPAKGDAVRKGTEGKHWHWHDHKSSKVANLMGGHEGNGYKGTHNADVSRFTKTFPNAKPGDASANVHSITLHSHLVNSGFEHKGTTIEDLPWRESATAKYSHPDGTQVESVVNNPKDSSTEAAHGYSVYHAPATQAPAKLPETAPAEAQGVNHPVDHVAVANTILQQYGGNKFRAMTGANNFTASKEKGGALTMKLPRTAGATKGVKYVKTVHDPASDTYDVHMLGRNGDVKHSASGIYADQLQSHFKHHTGLDTHL